MKKNDVQIGATYLIKVASNLVPVKITREHDHGGWEGTSLKTGKTIRIKTAGRLRKLVADQPATRTTEPLPDPAKMTIHALRDGDTWCWVVRHGKEDMVSEGDCDSEAKASKAGQAWLRAYTKAGQAKRRQMLGWKPVTETGGAKASPTVATNAATANPDDGSATGATDNQERDTGEPKVRKPRNATRPSLINAAAEVLADADEPMSAKAMVEQAIQRGLWTPGSGKTPEASLYAAIIREIGHKGDQARFSKVERGRFTMAKGA